MSYSLETAVAKPAKAQNVREKSVVVNAGTATATLTSTQVLSKLIYVNPAANASFTLPTAAALVSADKQAEAGTGFQVLFSNRGAATTATLVTSTGVTLAGLTAVVAAVSGAVLYLQYTNVTSGAEAYTVTRLV